jgi:hypothetical protein
MTNRKTPLWLGFLDAGKSSSPVVRDSSLDTGNPATIYLFNLTRGRILEYRKDIVEQKLRELTADESSQARELESAFLQAKTGFTPRGRRRLTSARSRRSEEPDEPEFNAVDGDSWPIFDDDMLTPHPAEQLN